MRYVFNGGNLSIFTMLNASVLETSFTVINKFLVTGFIAKKNWCVNVKLLTSRSSERVERPYLHASNHGLEACLLALSYYKLVV